MSGSPPDDIAAALERLHTEVDGDFDRTTAALTIASGRSIGCRPGCCACCQDGLSVFEVEAERIRRWVGERAMAGMPAPTPHPAGRCAFLDADGKCQVFVVRPYVCRSQGAILGWSEDDRPDPAADDAPAEPSDADPWPQRATCAEHLHGLDLSALPTGAVLPLGVREPQLVALATMALSRSGGRGLPPRISLRRLARALQRQAPPR